MLKFTITNTDGVDYVVDEPRGFDGVNLRLLRNSTWHGFFNFIDDSAMSMEFSNYPKNNSYPFDVLKNDFETYGLMANATLKIEFACSDTDSLETLFVGRFDFNKYVEYCGDMCYCSISVEEESCLMNFKNRYDQKVDLGDLFPFDKICDESVTEVSKSCFIEAPNVIAVTTSNDLNGLNIGNTVTLDFTTNNANDGANKIINIELNKDNTLQDYYYFETNFSVTGVSDTVKFSGTCLKLLELYPMPFLNKEVEFTPKPLLYKDVWQSPNPTNQYWQDEKLRLEPVGSTSEVWNPIKFTEDILTEINDSVRYGIEYQAIPQPASVSLIFVDNENQIITLQKDSKLTCTHDIEINLRLKGTVTKFCGETAKCGLVLNLRWGDFIDHAVNSPAFTDTIFNAFGSGVVSGGTTSTSTFDITYSTTLTLDPTKEYPQKIYLNWEMFNMEYFAGPPTLANTLQFNFDYEICKFEAKQTSICESTKPKVYLINEVFGRITEKYTNECLKTFSRFFGRYDSLPYTHQLPSEIPTNTWGCGGLLSLTNGLKIRNALNNDGNEYSLKVSMKDVFEAMKSVYNIGMGIEYDEFKNDGSKLIRIEPYKYFYNDSVVFTATFPKKVEKRVNTNKYISLVDVGYSTWTTESTNGLNDVFTDRNYRTELSTVQNTYKAICEFIASDYAIEITRRKWGSITNDWRYDNDTFIVMLEPDGDDLKSETFDFPANVAENINFPEYCYNLRITPARNLLRHISTIFASYNDLIGKSLVFLDGKGNYVARIDITSEDCLDENKGVRENIRVTLNDFSDTDFPIPIFSNESVIFEYPLAYNDWKAITLNPYGLIEYSCADGVSKYGWIQDLKYNPTTFIGEFTLIEKI